MPANPNGPPDGVIYGDPFLPAPLAREITLQEVRAASAKDVTVLTAAEQAAVDAAVLVAATDAVAAEVVSNKITLLAATDAVAAEVVSNKITLLAATDAVAAAVFISNAATDAILNNILVATSAPVAVSNFPATQPVSGTVSVGNFPATQPVSGLVSNTPVQNSGKVINRFVLAQAAAPGTTVIAAASPGNKHKVIGVVLSLSAAGTVKFRDTVDLTGAMNLSAAACLNIPPNPTFPVVETLANRALNIVTTGGGANGIVLYITEP